MVHSRDWGKYGQSEEYEGEPRHATEQFPMPVPETLFYRELDRSKELQSREWLK